MEVPISDAKAQLSELVRRAEAGETVVLTRHGSPAARLVPVAKAAVPLTPEEKRRRLQHIREIVDAARRNMVAGPDAARSGDYLYDELGLPK